MPALSQHSLRIVRFDPDYDLSDYTWFQANYLHPTKKMFFPCTKIFVGDNLIFEVNSFGCKGAEPEVRAPLVAIFGDSVVQGLNRESFVDYICFSDHVTLNGGVEGSTLRPTIDRMLQFHAQYPLVCAAVHTGWHNLVYDERSEDFWREQLDRVQGPPLIAHFTLVADINPDVLEAGYEHLFHPGIYTPWPGVNFADRHEVRQFYNRLLRFNEFIREYCESRGRILIDLANVLAPRRFTDVGMKFFDLIHPRPSAYEMIGKEIYRQLLPHLTQNSCEVPNVDGGVTPLAPGGDRRRAAPEIGKNYPLW